MALAKYDNTDGRLRGRRAQARRLRIWTKSPCCAMCGKLTDYPNGFEIDHVKPLDQGGEDVDSNLQVLCAGSTACHAKKTISENHNDPAVSFFPEWLEPSACDLTIVYGPPASGKSTYVSDRAVAHDLVIDLDVIISDLSRMPIYHAPDSWLRRAVYFRNRMLASLSTTNKGKAWFVTSGQGVADRRWWESKLEPRKSVTLCVPQHECIERIKADERRPGHVKDRHIDAVKIWWLAENGMATGKGPLSGFGADGWPL